MYTMLLAHVFLTIFMLGVIWFVQLIQYPLLKCLGNENCLYEQRYFRRMTYFTAPCMFLEMVTGCWLLVIPELFIYCFVLWANVWLLVIIWLSSLCVQLPMHYKLSQGVDKGVYRWLVCTNWIRTGVWSLRACLLMWVLYWLVNR